MLLDHIQLQLRHKHYDRTLAVREFSHQIVTGENQGKIIERYRRSESEDLKKQRIRLTNTLTKYAISRPRKYWKKIARVEGINVDHTSKDKERIGDLHATFKNFQDGRDLIQYLNWKLEFLGVTDPNAWVIYERLDTRDAEDQVAKVRVYPFVVPCEDVLNFDYKFGELEWIVVRTKTLETTFTKGAKVEAWLEDFYLYAPGFLIRAREVGKKTKPEKDEKPVKVRVGGAGPTKTFLFSAFQNGTTEVPALPVGAYQDEKTEQQSFVPWFDPAEHVLCDLIRDKSFLDVTKTVHAFPKRWEYVRPCTYESKEAGGKCERGFLSGDLTKRCPACGGSGKSPTFQTEQSVLQLAMPKGDLKDLLELSRLSHMESPSIDLPKWLAEQVAEAERRVMNAVFNSGIIEKASGQADKTATQTNYEYEDIYDVLEPFAATISRHYELAYRVAAQYMTVPDFTVSHRFPKDFKLKTLDDLLTELEKMKSSGAGFDAIRSVRLQIIEKQHEDEPQSVARIIARYDWLPFDDKSESEVAMILAGRSPLDFQRVLRENWLEIFVEIEHENDSPQFFELEHDRQKKIVEEKVAEFKARIILAGDTEPEDLNEGGSPKDDDETETPESV